MKNKIDLEAGKVEFEKDPPDPEREKHKRLLIGVALWVILAVSAAKLCGVFGLIVVGALSLIGGLAALSAKD